MTVTLTGPAILALLQATEKNARRTRTEQGRSPAQKTTRSANKARRFKKPGKGARRDWRKEL